jgi:hypothetical protein
MPRYKSRSKSRAAREKKRIRAQVPRDKRKLSHWAVRGTAKDYQKLRDHAAKHADTKPSYVTDRAVNLFKNATRRSLIEATHERDNHWFTDGLAWMLDKVPSGIGLNWVKKIGQSALKPFRGDSIDEVDMQYARLVDEAYKDEGSRDNAFEHWDRQSEFDSDYMSVYDNQDGHRFVAVRGTKMNMQDLREDMDIGIHGRPDNLIGSELKRILDNTEPGRTVDVGGHSLGTSLILTAFDNDDQLQNRVHQTYLYNPAVSPISTEENVTQKYEHDERVRYFIDLLDPVSVGNLGEIGPTNVVYRTSYLNPLHSHQLSQWGGESGLTEHDDALLQTEHLLHQERGEAHKNELPYDQNRDGVPDDPRHGDAHVETADDFLFDFGEEHDSKGWEVYWNQP